MFTDLFEKKNYFLAFQWYIFACIEDEGMASGY